jgi:hypothetical protein
MYNWLVFLHIFFAFALMLAHGAHAAAMLAFRTEKDPERSLTFFNNVPDIKVVRYLAVLMGLAGFVAAFITPWWRQGWVWASVAVYLIITFVMYRYGGGYYGMISDAARQAIEAKRSNTDVEAALRKFEEVRTSSQPMMVALVGVAGLAIILWLMRFKPF